MDHYLDGLRVLEIADETGEYVGKVLAGLGADVVKVEAPEGESTRDIGPFRDDVVDREGSLFFWHYNHGKRSIVLDLETKVGQERFRALSANADLLVDTRKRTYLADREIGYEKLKALNSALIYARIRPFGDSGPWADFEASDLIHLALGGVMMNCGYDPHPRNGYETPPIAPQMWHAYHIAGEAAVIGILGALAYRRRTGRGQALTVSIHNAVSQNTETDLPDWVYLRQPHHRQTCRHSFRSASVPSLAITKDGRYMLPYKTYLQSSPTFSADAPRAAAALLAKYGMDEGLHEVDDKARLAAQDRLSVLIDRLCGRLMFTEDLWRDGQEHGLPWAPVRRPEENAVDPHWIARKTFTSVYHPEAGADYTYLGARWYSEDAPWKVAKRRPPRLGEHGDVVAQEWSNSRDLPPLVPGAGLARSHGTSSAVGKPFALAGVRVLDLGWMLASAGAGRYLAALGADVIKVEHIDRIDGLRYGAGRCPPGGRAEREAAADPMATPPPDNPNRCGAFSEVNSGKRGLSLNLKSARGRQILESLIREVDVIVEGFSPGTMERMGLGYGRLKELNPRIIYAQQSGLGEFGQYGRTRAFGPTAQAFSGISEMSGLADPFPPAGIGYSYLDWFGAYNLATAMLAALHRQASTGRGCHIDGSQTEVGLYLTGTAILDHSVNARRWSRYGNRSPYKKAAPHAAYRTRGNDAWIAIAAFTNQQWVALATDLGHPEWIGDPRFNDLDLRYRNQDALDRLIGQATSELDGYDLMYRLQAVGVPAGVCQTAQDRCERDPQLRHEGWQIELPQSEIGIWPVKDFPASLEETPGYAGGVPSRAGPNYGEDTDAVLSAICGLNAAEIAELREAAVI